MPTYDYVCDACGHKFELFQSMMDSVKRKCPECKKSKLRRLIGTGAAIMFKGSGFYQTDYRSDNYKKQAAAEKSSNGSSESKAASGSESKAGSSDNKSGGSETKSSGSDSKSSGSETRSSGSESKSETSKPRKKNKQ